MASLEDVLDAFAVACDVWLSSGDNDECPTAEFAPLVRQAVDEENARLRELVRDMYKAFMHGDCYQWCEFKEPCNYISDGRCQWYDRMRELGIEVTS